MQVFNETEALDGIYRKEAANRIFDGASKKSIYSHKAPANLPDPTVDKSKRETREKLSEVTGVPQKKLETIIELGKLAKTGKTKEERKHEEDIIT
jgi:hypothetical protein